MSADSLKLTIAIHAALVTLGLGSSTVSAENFILKDENQLVCSKVREKLNGFGAEPLVREITLLLFEASKKSCGALVRELISMDAGVDARDRSASTPLMKAAEAGHLDIVKYLQSIGADINHLSLRGNTALLLAVRSNRAKVVKYLLQQGADPNTRSLDNVTPLSAACFDGNTRLIKYLLDFGANPDMRDGTGKAPIIYAAAKGFSNVVRILIDKGVDPNQRYGSGLTALMWAAGHTSDTPGPDGIKTLKVLTGHEVDLDVQDARGMTALMYAYQLNNTGAASLLLSLGADPNITSASGKIAAEFQN